MTPSRSDEFASTTRPRQRRSRSAAACAASAAASAPPTPRSRGGRAATGQVQRAGASDSEDEKAFLSSLRAQTAIVEAALVSRPIAVAQLRSVAVDGFRSDELRNRAWPHLLKARREEEEAEAESTVLNDKHQYWEQVRKDIERSLCHFDVNKDWNSKQLSASRESLSRIVDAIFSANPSLHYVQGFHDVVSVFFLVCGEEVALELSESLSRQHIRDTLRPNLDAVARTLGLILPLTELSDPEVHRFLVRSEVECFFALPWVLTWFAHSLENFEDIKRLYDFFLASHPLMPLYYAVATIIRCRGGLLRIECEYSHVHQFFQDLPEDRNLERTVRLTLGLFRRFPPVRLLRLSSIELPRDSPLLVDHVWNLDPNGRDYALLSEKRISHQRASTVGLLVLVPLLATLLDGLIMWFVA